MGGGKSGGFVLTVTVQKSGLLKIQQLARLSDLPNRPTREDEIGLKLQALGLLEPTATPKDKSNEARTPTTQTPRR